MSRPRTQASQRHGKPGRDPVASTVQHACALARQLSDGGRLGDAFALLAETQRLAPDDVMVRVELAEVARRLGRTGVAVDILQKTLLLAPTCAEAHNNLGVYLREQGEIAASLQHYRRALELRPGEAQIWSGYLFTLHGDPEASAEAIAERHRYVGTLWRTPSRPRLWRSPGTVLRVAYLSGDFRRHPVATFIAPVIAAHDRRSVHVTCYAASPVCDEMTRQIQERADAWRCVDSLDDGALADLVARDGIDVLVELSGHTAGNRLAALARRLAPVQMTYLGYPDTTGVPAIDYRITDALVDPPGSADELCTEKLLRLPGGFLAYHPPAWMRALPVTPSPVKQSGVFTFGSFGNLARSNGAVLSAWAEILARVPTARLVLKAPGLHDPQVRKRVGEVWAAHGRDVAARVVLLEPTTEPAEHLGLHALVDLALDTFPYNGTTTTCEALWMGVPVLTLRGDRHAGRVGADLLARLGLHDFIATDVRSYVDAAVALAQSWAAVAALREELRPRLAASSLSDAVRLAGELEACYRQASAACQTPDPSAVSQV